MFDHIRRLRVTSDPMHLFIHRRIIAGTALLAFLFAITFPALAVARQAIDPTAFATICSVDTSVADTGTLPGSPQSRLKTAHCLMCLGTVSPSPAVDSAVVVVVRIPELAVLAARNFFAGHDPAAFQPQNPRAPPRA